MSRKPYTTDLTDAQWQAPKACLPKATHGRTGRPHKHDLREVVKGRKRHIAADTDRLLCPTALMAVWVSPASVGNRDGARETLGFCYGTSPRLAHVWAGGVTFSTVSETVERHRRAQ